MTVDLGIPILVITITTTVIVSFLVLRETLEWHKKWSEVTYPRLGKTANDKVLFLFLSGRSDYRHNQLTEEQRRLLHDISSDCAHAQILETSFPFQATPDCAGEPMLVTMGMRNFWQTVLLKWHPQYRRDVAVRLAQEIDNIGPKQVVIVAGSIGTQMALEALPRLTSQRDRQVALISVGGFTFDWKNIGLAKECVQIESVNDVWCSAATAFKPRRISANRLEHVSLACGGHMDYLRQSQYKDVLGHAKRCVARFLQ